VVPVVDFAALLQLPADTGRHRVWIVIGDEHREWAVPAREARRIVDIPADAIDEVGQARGGLVSGIATVDDRLLPLLGTRLLLEAT
jgi:chemotaxis signal transduction protein